MKYQAILLVLVLTLFTLASAQQTTTPPPAKGPASPHHNMAAMQKEHMAGMQADLDKMKSSLEQMKANVANISDATEKARWQSNVDLWTVMVGHMEQMMKHMQSMGPGMGMGPGIMHHGHMGASPTPPPDKNPSDKKE